MTTETIEYVENPLDAVTEHIRVNEGAIRPFIITSGARFHICVNKWSHMKIPAKYRFELYDCAVPRASAADYYLRDEGVYAYEFVTEDGVRIDTQVVRDAEKPFVWTYQERHVYLPKTLYTMFVRINSGLRSDELPLLPAETCR
jgi:hypothetical protein